METLLQTGQMGLICLCLVLAAAAAAVAVVAAVLFVA